MKSEVKTRSSVTVESVFLLWICSKWKPGGLWDHLVSKPSVLAQVLELLGRKQLREFPYSNFLSFLQSGFRKTALRVMDDFSHSGDNQHDGAAFYWS